MHFPKGVIVRIVLVSVLALSVNFGPIAEAGVPTPTPPPPQGTPIVLQTYGVLPVMVLNLTQSALNYYVTPGVPAVYSGSGAPVAIGLHGLSFVRNGVNSSSTPYFNNPTTPSTAPNGANNPSLNPVLTVASGPNPVFSAATANPNWSFMNAFALFPSWSGSVTFPNTQYQVFNGSGASMGATPGSAINQGSPNNWTVAGNAYGQSMNLASTTQINMNLLGSGGAQVAGYTININSLGGLSSGAQTPSQANAKQTNWLKPIMTIVGDIDSLVHPDIADMSSMIYGIYSSIKAMAETPDTSFTIQAYPAAYKGVNVTAASTTGVNGATLTAVAGLNNFLMYFTQPMNSTVLPIEQDNGVVLLTWRTTPGNTSTQERNSADTLIVLVVNQGVYAANQARQFLKAEAEAEDMLKLLAIFHLIDKKNPQDYKKIMNLFGFQGQYGTAGNDPNAAAKIKMTFKEVLEKYRKEAPAVEQYLEKLAHLS